MADGNDDPAVARTRPLRTSATAVVSAITQISITIALTSLLFRGELVGDLRLALTAMFAGLFATAVIVALRSGLPGHVAGPQDAGLVVISTMTPAIVAGSDRPGATALVLMGIGAVVVGLEMYAIGALGLGRLIRFLPFPVMAGFLAGTGLVMARATVELIHLGMSGDATGGSDRWLRYSIAGCTALAMIAITRSRMSTERVLPVLVIGTIAAVHLGLLVAGIERHDAADRALLLPVQPEGSLATTDSVRFVLDADWGVVAENLVGLLPLLILVPLTALLYLGGLEATTGIDLDANREFRITGGANMISGVVGAAPGYTQFAATTLVQRMAGPNRVVPAVIGLSALLVLTLGDRVVAFVPEPVVAGLLGFIALSFLLDWVWDTVDRMSRVEWCLAAAIAVSILVLGFLPGIAIGITTSAAWFIVEYSRMSGVRRLRDATQLRSNVERTAAETEALELTGETVLVVEPEGYLFFGTGDSIVRRVARRADGSPIRHVIVDLAVVTGADSSAAAAFAQLERWSRQHGVELIWCGLRPRTRKALSSLLDVEGTIVLPDLDRALERTEAARLDGGSGSTRPPTGLLEDIPALRDYGSSVHHPAGTDVFTRGEDGPGLVVIESGWAEVLGEPGTRRRRVGPGAVLGEIGIAHHCAATATVRTATDVVATVLDRDGIARLQDEQPEAAAALFRHIARSLSLRLLRSDAEVASFAYRPQRD